jgi:hypothetical protein
MEGKAVQFRRWLVPWAVQFRNAARRTGVK